MAKVELKQPIVAEISEAIKEAQSVVLVDYRGLTVEQDTNLRKQLREAGVTYKVYKNTMMNFAFKGTDFEGLAPYLEGPSAVAISTTDATAPARILAKFAKDAKLTSTIDVENTRKQLIDLLPNLGLQREDIVEAEQYLDQKREEIVNGVPTSSGGFGKFGKFFKK